MYKHRVAHRLAPLLGAAAMALVLGIYAGCSPEGSAPASQVVGTLRLTVHWPQAGDAGGPRALALGASDNEVSVREIPPDTQTVVITVTGPGIGVPITRTITRPDVIVPVTRVALRVPPGSWRQVAVDALDEAGVLRGTRPSAGPRWRRLAWLSS
jgi:hypothetical protein